MTITKIRDNQPWADIVSEERDLPTLNDALASLQKDLERLRLATEHIEESKEAAREATEAGRQVAQRAAGLAGSTASLVDRLERVDFPSRLDKLDATVSALQVGLQTTQGRLENVERHLQDAVQNSGTATIKNVQAVGRAVAAAQASIEALAEQQSRQVEATRRLRMLLYGALGGLGILVLMSLAVLLRQT